MSQTLKRTLLALLCALGCLVEVRGQVTAPVQAWQADTQIWAETALNFRARPRALIQVFGTLRPGRDVTTLVAEQVGVGVGFTLNKYVSTFAAYRFAAARPTPNRSSTEHRYFFDVAAQAPLGKKFVVSDRNRYEFRDILGVISHRYRNRVQAEREVIVADRRVIPYVSCEFLYDDRFHVWNQRRYFVGSRLPVNKHLTLDAYFLRQLDRHARPDRVSAIGLMFRWDL